MAREYDEFDPSELQDMSQHEVAEYLKDFVEDYTYDWIFYNDGQYFDMKNAQPKNANKLMEERLDDRYSIYDFSDEALAQAEKDLDAFYDKNDHLLSQVEDEQAMERVPFLFWLSRNWHGSGFFDEDNIAEELRDQLQEAAHRFGEVYVYVGDDGKLYFG